MPSLIWLASYPKSGNTWLRALLTHYLMSDGDTFDLNALQGDNIADYRSVFDEHLGASSADMSMERLGELLPLFHELLAQELSSGSLIKTHQAFGYSKSGQPYFSPKSARCAIYLVRNPLDIAVSYAPFAGWSLEAMIDHLGNPEASLNRGSDHGSTVLPNRIGSWSDHVRGWHSQSIIPTRVMRYEDLIEDTEAGFQEIVRFAGYDIDNARIRSAVEACSFGKLAEHEREHGFERIPVASGYFFRKGTPGDGLATLTAGQVERIVRDHGEVMEMFGYLPRHSIPFRATER